MAIEPRTHQGLLDAYVADEESLIGEFSTSFVSDYRELVADVEKYAALHGLSTDCLSGVREEIQAAEADGY